MKAMYCGSFDPLTLGHLDIVQRALAARSSNRKYPKYEHLVICVGVNPEKEGFLKPEKRKELIEGALKDCLPDPDTSRVSVICAEGLTVDVAQAQGVDVLIRGIRLGTADENKEVQLAAHHRQLAHIRGYELPTDYIIQDTPDLQFISSSMVRLYLEYKEYIGVAERVPRNVCQELLINPLWKRFEDARRQRGNHLNPSSAWGQIKEAYLPRPYHNLIHLAYMLNMFDIYKRQAQRTEDYRNIVRKSNSIEMAIFAHDVVYDGESDRNEAASVEKLKEWEARGWMRCVNVLEISELIMATTHQDENLTGCCALIADLDLCILGTSNQATWKAYNQAIREEYAAYADEVFLKGRSKFLSELLKREHIFQTEFFRNRFEVQARRNIAKELQRMAVQSVFCR